MAFWALAYTRKWVTIDQLRQAVLTDSNPYGQITPEQFQTITGEEFA
ncbi:XkdX family protein [Caproiciproducens sp. CPB-2]|nr:XkdX family protein [Caproiciproducens sp. CPB-2]MDF1495226.1 XkdX family protein [Caproiciproducens sp. CPB-2]